MPEREIFVLADETLLKVVEQISDEQMEMPLPDWFPRSVTQKDLTLRKILEYHAYDDAWVPDMVAGKTMDEVGKATFDGELLGEDWRSDFAAIVERASLAVLAVDDMDRVAHLSFGDYPVREYLWQANMFRGLRAHDIAKLIGADTKLPDTLVEGLWAEIAPHAEEWRAIGVFGKAVNVPEDAPLQDRLLGLTGREPDGEYAA
jgi:uncharacterized protein (TIGR03086 family)